MKNFLFSIAIYCLLLINPCYSQWQTITVPVSGQDVFGISFINDTSAYVSVDHDLVYTQNDFSSFTTLPWSTYLLGQPISTIKEDLREIRFTDISHGLLTGGFNTFNDYMILQTDNGGLTWDIIYNSSTGPILRYISAMDFNNGIGLGAGGNGRIVRSTNDGDTWISVSSNTTENLLEVQFINSNSAIAVGEDALLRSADAGATWTTDPGFSNTFLYGLAVANNGINVYASAYDKFFYSLNGGASFDTVNLPFSEVNCLVATGADTVFAGTAAGIYMSKDHGIHWEQFLATQTYYINRLVIQNGMLYALCNDGFILRNGLSALAPEPIASFTQSINEMCGQTDVTVISNSYSSYSYSWYLNGILQSTSNTGFNYNRSNSTTDSISVVVDNGISTDTAYSLLYVYVREFAILPPVPDQSGCYGQNFIVTIQTNPGHTYRSSVNNSAFASFSPYLENTTVNTTLVIEANTSDNCPVYDTSYYSISGQVTEPFLPTIPVPMLNNWRIGSVDATSDNIVFALAENGDFYKSIDGSTTWTKTNITTNVTRFNFIDFVNDTLGYIPDVNLKTVNGGTSFALMPALLNQYGDAGYANFLNTDIGIIANEPDDWAPSHWRIFITTDGGQTFTQSHYNDSMSFWISDVKALSATTFFASGGTSLNGTTPYIRKTTDAGLSWTNLNAPGNYSISAIDVLNEDTIFAIGTDDYVYRTYNGGNTWYTFYLGFNGCGCGGGIKMVTPQLGYLFRGLGEVYKTENGGECWTQVAMLNDNDVSRIAVTPSGSDIYISGENVYHYHTGKNLQATIDSGYCADSPIYTHNASSGYTSYAWYLDGQLYSSQRDTVFRFSSAGNHIITLYADSAGTGLDSIQYPVSVQPSIGSVGTITGPASACRATGFPVYHFTAGSNPQVTQYIWSSNAENVISTDLSTQTDSVLDVIFDVIPNWSQYITLYAMGISAAGCYTSDTASFLLHLVHTTPSTPTLSATQSNCYFIPEDSMNSFSAFDSVLCSVNSDPMAEYYVFGQEQTTDTFAIEEFYPGCPGNVYLTARAENSCGSSSTALLPVNIFYIPDQVTHTPDTAVEFGTYVRFYFHPYTNSDLLNCGPLDIWWTVPDGSSQHTNDEFLDVWSFFISDTGYYTPYCVLGCDTVFATFHVGDAGWVGIQSSVNDVFYFKAHQQEGIIQTKYSLLSSNAEMILSDVTGRILKTLRLVPGTSSAEINISDLSAGIFQLQLISYDKMKTIKLIIN